MVSTSARSIPTVLASSRKRLRTLVVRLPCRGPCRAARVRPADLDVGDIVDAVLLEQALHVDRGAEGRRPRLEHQRRRRVQQRRLLADLGHAGPQEVRGERTEQAAAAELRGLLAVSQRRVSVLAVVVGVARAVALVLLTAALPFCAVVTKCDSR
jgi:hypothetical protein